MVQWVLLNRAPLCIVCLPLGHNFVCHDFCDLHVSLFLVAERLGAIPCVCKSGNPTTYQYIKRQKRPYRGNQAHLVRTKLALNTPEWLKHLNNACSSISPERGSSLAVSTTSLTASVIYMRGAVKWLVTLFKFVAHVQTSKI